MKTSWMTCLPALALLGCLTGACAAKSDGASSDSAATTNAITCTAEGQLAAYNAMITQPIQPPRMFAGIDLANGDSWPGLKIEDAEKTLCGANQIGVDGTSMNVGWGIAPSYQVTVEYDQTSHEINFYQLNAGYKGTLDFKSRATALGDSSKPNPFGQHTYSIGVDTPILRDGQPWALDWTNFDAQATEMYDALMATFAPELPSTQTDCNAEQVCLATPTGGTTAAFGARPLGIYFEIADTTQAPSTPQSIYGFPVKSLPFSVAAVTAKLDAEGPIATAIGIGDKKDLCTMKLGMTMQSFLDNCVTVMNDAHTNDLLREKTLGGAQRVVTTGPGGAASGTWDLVVSGTHPNFSSLAFNETAPTPASTATEIAIDVRTPTITNEFAADGTTKTLAATTAIYQEYMRTLQALAQSKMDPSLPRYNIGDAHCILAANADAKTWKPAPGCTGLEQIVLPTATNGYATILKPGYPVATFCADPVTFAYCFQPCDDSGSNCIANQLGQSAAIWASPKAQLVSVLANGNAASLAPELQDTNTYITLLVKAMVKYLRAAPQSPTDLSSSAFDSFAPADSDITLTPGANGLVTVTYQTHLEIQLDTTAGNITAITFR